MGESGAYGSWPNSIDIPLSARIVPDPAPGMPESECFPLLIELKMTRPLLAALLTAALGFCALGVAADEAAAKSRPEAKASLVPAKQLKKPRAKPRFKLSHRHVALGEAVRLRGSVRPGGRRAFKVVVRGPRSAVLKKRTDRRGRYRQRWRPKRPGIYRLRAYAGHNGRARGGAAVRKTITVYRPAHASWYGPGFYGNRTACGQTLTPGTLGVAHKTLPCGTKLRLKNGKRRVTVRVIDRGPFIPGREFDLTYATKLRLGFGDLGTVYASR